ncbi:unnamed protein product [Cunninghamella blakesleeana]
MEIAAGYIKDNAETIAQKIIETTEELIACYQGVGKDAEGLAAKLQNVKYLVEDVKSCEGMPGDSTLLTIHLKIEESRKAIKEFEAEEQKIKDSKNVVKRSAFKVKKFFIYAPDFTAQFKDLSDILDKLPDELERIRALSESLLKTTNLAYKDEFINDECRKFWISIAGTDIGSQPDRWSSFQEKYELNYLKKEKWSGTDWNRVKSAACIVGSDLTLFGFINLTNKAGFPINIEEVPSILDSNHSMTDGARIEVGKMINDLIAKFSSEEMNNHIVSVIKWYGSFSKEDTKHLILPEKKENETDEEKDARKEEERRIIKQYKAEECYKIIKRMRIEDKPSDQWDKREKMAQDVERARREVVFFYQQFLVICEFGRLSRTIFENVDFPGKARLKSFIGDYKPLDFANFTVIIGGDPNKWEDKQPKVYKFVQDFLHTEKTRKENTDDMEFTKKAYEAKKKELEDLKKRLEERERKLNEREGKYTAEVNEHRKKVIIDRFRLAGSLANMTEKQPKTTKEKIKESAQKLKKKQSKISMEKNKESTQNVKNKIEKKVENNASKKSYDEEKVLVP